MVICRRRISSRSSSADTFPLHHVIRGGFCFSAVEECPHGHYLVETTFISTLAPLHRAQSEGLCSSAQKSEKIAKWKGCEREHAKVEAAAGQSTQHLIHSLHCFFGGWKFPVASVQSLSAWQEALNDCLFRVLCLSESQ